MSRVGEKEIGVKRIWGANHFDNHWNRAKEKERERGIWSECNIVATEHETQPIYHFQYENDANDGKDDLCSSAVSTRTGHTHTHTRTQNPTKRNKEVNNDILLLFSGSQHIFIYVFQFGVCCGCISHSTSCAPASLGAGDKVSNENYRFRSRLKSSSSHTLSPLLCIQIF